MYRHSWMGWVLLPAILGATPEVTMEGKALSPAACVGNYRAENGGPVSVRQAGDRLLLIAATEWGELEPMGEGVFRFQGDTRFSFSADAKGEADALVRSKSGEPDVALRRCRDLPWRFEELGFKSGDVSLSGTLVLPATPGPYPAVVMVHGSGPQSRDFCLSDRTPAGHFAKRGIAVLSYDKRGVGASTGDWQKASFEDLALDALAAVQLLKGRPDIRSDRIGLWGISQAGWIEPLAAVRSKDVAFLILVSAPAVTPGEQGRQNFVEELVGNGCTREKAEEALKDAAGLMEKHAIGWLDSRCRKDRGVEEVQAAARVLYREARERWWFKDSVMAALDEDYFAQAASATVGLDTGFDSKPLLRRLSCPVLAVYGEKDRCVPVEGNRALLEQALKAGGNKDVTVRVFPDANHSMMVCKTGTMAERGVTGIAPGFCEAMTDWILERFGRKP